jgi:hypothetical protein
MSRSRFKAAVSPTEGVTNANQFGLASARHGFRTLTIGTRHEF